MSGNQWHARLSASATKRWATCPGSTAVMERFPRPSKSGDAALQGTAAHGLSERCIQMGQTPSDYRGRLIEILDVGGEEGFSILKEGAKKPTKKSGRVVFEVDNDMIIAVSKMTGYVKARCVELGLMKETETTKKLVDEGVIKLESRVNPLPEEEQTGGSADVIIDAWPDVLEIVDYKHGSGVFVPVEGNPQLRSYGLGAALLLGAPGDYAKIRYTICQPRHAKAPAGGIMSEEVDPKELIEFGDWLQGAVADVGNARLRIARIQDIDEMLHALYVDHMLSVGTDGDGCTFCDLKGRCPAMKQLAQEKAAIDFADVPAAIDESGAGPNRLAALLPWLPLLKKWIEEVDALAHNEALKGTTIPEYKLVRGPSTGRVWKEKLTTDDIIASMAAFGIKREQLYHEPKMLTGVQAEKLLETEDDIAAFNKSMLHKPDGKLKLVPLSAKGDPVTVNVADDFDDTYSDKGE